MLKIPFKSFKRVTLGIVELKYKFLVAKIYLALIPTRLYI